MIRKSSSKWKISDWIILVEILAILILIVYLCSGCSRGGGEVGYGGPAGGPNPNPTTTGNVDGFVKYSDRGVQGATVYVANDNTLYKATTIASGYFKVEGISSGAQTIYVAAQGYNIASRAITVPDNNTDTLSDFNLTKTTQSLGFPGQINSFDPNPAQRSFTCLKIIAQSGSHFGENCGTVTIGGVAATCIRIWADLEIQVWIPATTPLGSVDVVANNGRGNSVPKTIIITQ